MSQGIIEAEFIGADELHDPDLNQAWFEFQSSINEEANSSGSIAVFEVPMDERGVGRPKTLNKAKLFTCPVGTATLDDICDRVREEFMLPGKRMMIQLLGTIQGQKGIRLNRMISLVKANPKTTEETGSIAALLKVMQEQRAQDRLEMREMISALATRQQTTITPAVDPLQLALTMTEKLAGLAGALNRPGGVAGAPGGDMFQQMQSMMLMMTTMKKFFGGGGDFGDAPKKDDESFGAIISAVKEIAVPLLTSHAAQAQAAAAHQKRLLMQTPPPPPPSTSTDANDIGEEPATPSEAELEAAKAAKKETRMKLISELSLALPTFVRLASENAKPEDVARLALSSMPDNQEMNDALHDFLSEEDCVKNLGMIDAQVLPHHEWFEALRAAMLASFSPEEPVNAGGSD